MAFGRKTADAAPAEAPQTTAVAAAPQAALPAAYDYGGSDLGFEGHGADDYKIPFLGVLQSNSPICADENSGARPGMIVNSVTGDLIKGADGLPFIPVATKHQYLEWIPRDSGGGLVGVHELDSQVVKEATRERSLGKIILPNGNELIETFTVYGIAITPNGTTAAVASFTSTKIKKYKNWMTKARVLMLTLPDGRKVKLPLMAHRYRLRTVKEKNKKGEFFNWDVQFDGENAEACRLAPNDELFQEAVALNKMVLEGVAQADHAGEAAKTGGESAGGGQGSDPDIPF